MGVVVAFCCSFWFLFPFAVRCLLLLFVALSCFWDRIDSISKTKTDKCLLLFVMAFCCSLWFSCGCFHLSIAFLVVDFCWYEKPSRKNQNEQQKAKKARMETSLNISWTFDPKWPRSKPCLTSTFEVSIVFIEKAFVVKIIQPYSNSWRLNFMSHAELAQTENTGNKPGFLRIDIPRTSRPTQVEGWKILVDLFWNKKLVCFEFAFSPIVLCTLYLRVHLYSKKGPLEWFKLMLYQARPRAEDLVL